MSLKLLGKQAIIYGVGHIAVRGVTFLLLPLYTNVFSLQDYGVISLAYTFLGFMGIVLNYGLDASLLKHYVPAEKSERTSILTTAYVSFFFTTLVFSLLFFQFRSQVGTILFGDANPEIAGLVAAILFLDTLWSIHVLILRAEGKAYYFTTVNLINVIITLTLNLLFVFKFQWGIKGVLLSNTIASGIIFTTTLPIIFRRISLSKLSWIHWKKLMHFGLPFLPSGVFAMILELSDRYVLRYLTDVGTVGLYSAGYKLGMLMMLVVMGFNMAWQPYFLKKEVQDRDYITKVTTITLTGLGFLFILIILWIDTIVTFEIGSFSPIGSEYWSATQIVPLIALAYIFHAAYLLQLPGVYLLEKSFWIPWIRGVGAVSNIALNFLLIPIYGIMGAATATCISFILMAVILFMVNKRFFPVNYEWNKILIIGSTVFLIWLLQSTYEFSVIVNLLLTAAYPLSVILFRVVNYKSILLLFTKNELPQN
ncbi:MAG: oligosaccharide flippase family protein [Candidatus Marinimicrobia bacterium]|nr:oligosaccharide flippase family protein [Candidatus Neomarinimicrobiota bacterium]